MMKVQCGKCQRIFERDQLDDRNICGEPICPLLTDGARLERAKMLGQLADRYAALTEHWHERWMRTQ